MIRFFRNIRKGLLSQNRISKYLFYAIGEILLVVVGILIALQVNNWNIAIKNRQDEKGILENLKKDFENAILELDFHNSLRDKIIFGGTFIYDLNEAKLDSLSNKRLDSIMALTFYIPTFNSQFGTLDLLFSSGKINLISNTQLRNNLISWPGEVEDYVEGDNLVSELFRGPLMESLSRHISIQNVINFFEFKKVNLYHKPNNLHSSNYNALIRDKDFMNILSRRIMHNRILVKESKDLINKINHINKLIERELLDD